MPTTGCYPGLVRVTAGSSCCACRACCTCSLRMLKPALLLLLAGVRNAAATAPYWKYYHNERVKGCCEGLRHMNGGEDTMKYAKEGNYY